MVVPGIQFDESEGEKPTEECEVYKHGDVIGCVHLGLVRRALRVRTLRRTAEHSRQRVVHDPPVRVVILRRLLGALLSRPRRRLQEPLFRNI